MLLTRTLLNIKEKCPNGALNIIDELMGSFNELAEVLALYQYI